MNLRGSKSLKVHTSLQDTLVVGSVDDHEVLVVVSREDVGEGLHGHADATLEVPHLGQ